MSSEDRLPEELEEPLLLDPLSLSEVVESPTEEPESDVELSDVDSAVSAEDVADGS